MNIWLTADTHFEHSSILAHTGRPFADVHDMNAALVENWNASVNRKDTVYILGDFAWMNHLHWLMKLNGKKILVFGNHDRMPQAVYRNFTQVVGTPKQSGIMQLAIDKQLVVVSHFPLHSWNGSCYGSWHFFGHCHGRVPEHDDVLRCDVGVDAWGYAPVPWEVLKAKMLARVPAWKARRQDSDITYDDTLKRVADLAAVNAGWRRRVNEARIHAHTHPTGPDGVDGGCKAGDDQRVQYVRGGAEEASGHGDADPGAVRQPGPV